MHTAGATAVAESRRNAKEVSPVGDVSDIADSVSSTRSVTMGRRPVRRPYREYTAPTRWSEYFGLR